MSCIDLLMDWRGEKILILKVGDKKQGEKGFLWSDRKAKRCFSPVLYPFWFSILLASQSWLSVWVRMLMYVATRSSFWSEKRCFKASQRRHLATVSQLLPALRWRWHHGLDQPPWVVAPWDVGTKDFLEQGSAHASRGQGRVVCPWPLLYFGYGSDGLASPSFWGWPNEGTQLPIKGIFPPFEMLVQPLLSPLPCQGPRLWELRAGPRSSEMLVFRKKINVSCCTWHFLIIYVHLIPLCVLLSFWESNLRALFQQKSKVSSAYTRTHATFAY